MGHFIIVTSETYYFEEYYLTDKGRSWFLEKQKKFVKFFKNYIVFVLYEDNMCKLCVFDQLNQIFILFKTDINNILSIITDKERIHILYTTGVSKKICAIF
jgi:hypothetical protein